MKFSNEILKVAAAGVFGLLTLPAFAQTAPVSHLVPVAVQKLNYDTESMMVTASGVMPNLCTAAPRPELRATANSSVLQLVVNGEMNGDVCMALALVGNSFELAFDIRSLKFNLADLHLDSDGTYKIIGADGKLVAIVDFGKVPFDQPFASHQISNAKLALTENGSIIAVASDSTSVEVRSPIIDLKKYIGRPVDMSGLVVNAHSDDFSTGRSQIERPLFLLTGLNTTTQ